MSTAPVRKSGRIARGRASIDAPTERTSSQPTASTATVAPEIPMKTFQELMAEKHAAKTKQPAGSSSPQPSPQPINHSAEQPSNAADLLAARRKKLLEMKQQTSQPESGSQPSQPGAASASISNSQTINKSPVASQTSTAAPELSQTQSFPETQSTTHSTSQSSAPSAAHSPLQHATQSTHLSPSQSSNPPRSPAMTALDQATRTLSSSTNQPNNQSNNQVMTPNRKLSTPIHHAIVTAPSSINGVELTRTIHTQAMDTDHPDNHSKNQSNNQSINQSSHKTARSLENQSPQPAAKRIKRSASKHGQSSNQSINQSNNQTIFQSINPQPSINLAEIDAELALFEAEIRKLGSNYQTIDQWMNDHPLSLAEADELLEEFEEEQSNSHAAVAAPMEA